MKRILPGVLLMFTCGVAMADSLSSQSASQSKTPAPHSGSANQHTTQTPQPAPDGDTLRIQRAVPAQPVESKPQTDLERGKRMSLHGEYKEAVDCFTRAANADQNNAAAYNGRSRAEWQLEQLKESLEDANWAIKLNSDYAEAFCTRAAIYNSMGRYQESVADAGMAIDLKPSLREGYLIESAAYHNLGQHKEADEALAKLNAISEPQSAFDEWQPKIDYNPYLSYLEATVRQNWHAQAGNYGTAVPFFKVHRDGSITQLRLIDSTGDTAADREAQEAVRRSAPFNRPPAGTPPDFDVYVVLDGHADPTAGKGQAMSASAQAPTQQPGQPLMPRVNWSGTFNQGLNIMRNVLQNTH